MVTVKMNKSKFQKFCVLYEARGGTQKVKKKQKKCITAHIKRLCDFVI